MSRDQRVRQLATGKWRGEILPALDIHVPPTAKKKGPCPACGGKDRFRFDDKNGKGTFFCNQCKPQSGNGLHLVMRVKHVSFDRAVDLVEDVLNGQAKPETRRRIPPSSPSSPPTIGASAMPQGIVGQTLFPYQLADGTVAFYVQRKASDGKKSFPQWGPTVDGTGWQPNLAHVQKPKPLYNLPEILRHPEDLILVHEGEKAAEAHRQAGLPGIPTTSSGGAKNAAQTDWTLLKGRRVVVSLDHDNDGERYGADVQRLTEEVGVGSVHILRLPNLPPKGDVVEWLQAGGTVQQFQELIDQLGVPSALPTVALADLIEQIETTLLRHISFPHDALATLIAVWVSLSYTFDCVQYCGFLVLRSATPRCGKTKVLRLLSRLLNGTPPILANVSAAALYRDKNDCMIIDECDRLRNADKEVFGILIAVLNVGFEAGAVIPRIDRATGDTHYFDVYGPMVLAGIEELADTLSDRAFGIHMVRSPKRMPRLNLRRLEPVLAPIRQGLRRWVDQHRTELKQRYEELPDTLHELQHFDERYQDLCEPLLVLADCADRERATGLRSRLLTALTVAAGRREPSGREAQFLAFLDLVEDRVQQQESCFVETATLLDLCDTVEDLADIESGWKLAELLKHFDLSPRPNPAGLKRGYLLTRDWIQTWRSRYPKQEET